MIVADIGVMTSGRLAAAGALVTLLNTLRLHLYVNNVVWGVTNVVGAYTEASFPGYASVLVNSWGSPFLNASNQGEVDEVIRNFVPASSGTFAIQGYYLTLPSGLIYGSASNGISGGVILTGPSTTYSVLPRMVEGDLC